FLRAYGIGHLKSYLLRAAIRAFKQSVHSTVRSGRSQLPEIALRIVRYHAFDYGTAAMLAGWSVPVALGVSGGSNARRTSAADWRIGNSAPPVSRHGRLRRNRTAAPEGQAHLQG